MWGNLIKLTENILANRYRRIVLSGQVYVWTVVNVVVCKVQSLTVYCFYST